MRPSDRKITLVVNLLILFVLTGCQWSCESSGTSSDYNFGEDGDYYITGGITKDLNDDLALITAELLRNDSILGTALITYDDDTLTFTDPYYVRGEIPAIFYPTGTNVVRVKDSTYFDVSFNNVMPDTFSISTVLQPAFRISEAVLGTLSGSDTPQSAALFTIIFSLPYSFTIPITRSGDSFETG